jgi:hypothetical protein
MKQEGKELIEFVALLRSNPAVAEVEVEAAESAEPQEDQ